MMLQTYSLRVIFLCIFNSFTASYVRNYGRTRETHKNQFEKIGLKFLKREIIKG